MLNKYKKRIQAIIFCIAIIVSCFSRYQPTAVYAAENESITVEYEDCKYEIYSDYAVLIKYQGENQSELNLSSTITYEGKEYNITQIASSAFSGATDLSTVKLPSGLKEIGYRAFSKVASMSAVSLPEGLETIGREAFNGSALKGKIFSHKILLFTANLKQIE